MILIRKFSVFAAVRNKGARNDSLLSPSVDIFLLGGASILALLLFRYWGVRVNPQSPILWAITGAVSFPHFLASYDLFYFKKNRAKGSPLLAYGFPLLLALVLAFAVVSTQRFAMVLLARISFAWLFWHFSQQAYGACLQLGGAELKGPHANQKFKKLLRSLCLLVGFYGYCASQVSAAPLICFGIYVPSFALGVPLVSFLFLLTALGLFVFFVMGHFFRISPTCFAPVLALFIWLQPEASGNGWFLLLPLFHGLQYLPFCVSELRHSTKGFSLFSGVVWWASLAAIGLLLLVGVPFLLETAFSFHSPERLAPAFLIFINLHHYLIDSVLWRSKRVQRAKGLGASLAF